jgi:hypothetical protein
MSEEHLGVFQVWGITTIYAAIAPLSFSTGAVSGSGTAPLDPMKLDLGFSLTIGRHSHNAGNCG